MKITFSYDEDKDIECLLTHGIGKEHEPGIKTKTYEQLLAFSPQIGNANLARKFVKNYISENSIDVPKLRDSLQENWDLIADEFEKRAEKIFGIKIRYKINAYMTIAGRYPYFPFDEDKRFFVSVEKPNANPTAMHELWHFYTGYKFGSRGIIDEKWFSVSAEALTVLLNIEFTDLMRGVVDNRYPHYAPLREIVTAEWKTSKDIGKVWNTLRSKIS